MKPRCKSRPASALWLEGWGRCPEHNGKRRFPTRTAAKRAARMQPERAAVYRCDRCGDYHLTKPFGIGAAIRYLEASLREDAIAAARTVKGPYVPPA